MVSSYLSFQLKLGGSAVSCKEYPMQSRYMYAIIDFMSGKIDFSKKEDYLVFCLFYFRPDDRCPIDSFFI